MAAPNYLNEAREYYRRNVERSNDAVKESVHVTTDVVLRMLIYINGEDKRFERNPVGAGSQKQSLKVKKADEFDYNIKLTCDTSRWTWGSSAAGRAVIAGDCVTKSGMPSPTTPRLWKLSKPVKDPVDTMDATLQIVGADTPLPQPGPGYVFLLDCCVGGSSVTWNDLCYGGDVTPFLVRKRLHKLMEQAIQRGHVPANASARLRSRLSGPALTFNIIREGGENISVDLVPFFDLPHLWPSGSDWPRPQTHRWLNGDKIRSVRAKGVQLVPKKNFSWLISFNFAETELLEGIDTGTGCRKMALRILKHLNNTHWCKMTKPPVSSYTLKNLLLWECEELPNDADWAPSMLWERLLGLTKKLHKCLVDSNAPLYFYPALNQLADKDPFELASVRGAIDKFLKNPLDYLKL